MDFRCRSSLSTKVYLCRNFNLYVTLNLDKSMTLINYLNLILKIASLYPLLNIKNSITAHSKSFSMQNLTFCFNFRNLYQWWNKINNSTKILPKSFCSSYLKLASFLSFYSKELAWSGPHSNKKWKTFGKLYYLKNHFRKLLETIINLTQKPKIHKIRHYR